MVTKSDKPDPTKDDTLLGNLLRLAGERAEIPLSIESRVYHRVEEEWRSSTNVPSGDKVYAEVQKSWRRDAWRGKIQRWLAPVGAAAAVVLAFAILSQPTPVPPPAVATVADVVTPTQAAGDYRSGSTVYEGDIIETGQGEGVSLLLARNASLRIDENTRFRVDATDEFTLLEGRIYVDTGQFIYRDGGLRIHTLFGVVSDIGTQFAVTTGIDSLDISVREGRVELAAGADVHSARMGQQLTLEQGQGASIGNLDTHDPYWDWIAALTPAFDTSNKSLLDFLKWAARETGRELRFTTDESRMFAMRTDVHGSISRLTPDEALVAILSTTTLKYDIESDKIVLEHRSID